MKKSNKASVTPEIQAEHDLFCVGMVCKLQKSDDHSLHLKHHQDFLLSGKWLQIMPTLDQDSLLEIDLHIWRHASEILIEELGYDATPPAPE